MADSFPIIEVPPDAPARDEQMGSKRKFWYLQDDGHWYQYKIARPNTGEDWSEKIAAELAELLGLPHADYELASWTDKDGKSTQGTVVGSFVSQGESLIHGNEILYLFDSNYPKSKPGSGVYYRVPAHTIDFVLRAVGLYAEGWVIQLPLDWSAPPRISTALDVFVGYLLLDAWIGNTDRHHQNWGWVRVAVAKKKEGPNVYALHLAPTFDHASSLGCHETDERRKDRLTTKDKGRSIMAYARKARSAFYKNKGDTRPMSTHAAFWYASAKYPEAARIWLDRLGSIGSANVTAIIEKVPSSRMSRIARDFAQALLDTNRSVLLDPENAP